MKALGLVVSEKKIFLYFPHDAPGAGPIWTPGARLAGFMKRTTIHCYTQNMKALGFVVSEKKIFLCFSLSKSMGANNPRGRVIFDPRAMVGRIIKRTTKHCYTQNMKALGLVVSEKKIFFIFSPLPIVSLWELITPGAGPVWTPGAQLAGFINRTTIHCYTQNMKALGLVVLEKKIFLCFSHSKSMGANNPRGRVIFDPRAMVGRIYKEDH